MIRFTATLLAMVLAAATATAQPTLDNWARDAQKRVVKIYGAGGLSGLEAYQSGFLVSPDGHVATAWSYVLDVDPIVVLDDGRRFESKIVDFEPSLELAVLEIEDVSNLPFFRIQENTDVQWGDAVIAVSNLFGIATGNEPASVMQGSVSAITQLDARRGTFKTPYRGKVMILDLIANNPGAAGGAVVDSDGQLVGMLGKELRDSSTGVWLNYAVPSSAIRTAIGDIIAGRKTTVAADAHPTLARDQSHNPSSLGIVLIPDVLESTPTYVDNVVDGSWAAKAELRPDDLILLVDGRRVESQRSFRELLRTIDRRDTVELTVQRDTEILPLVLATMTQRPSTILRRTTSAALPQINALKPVNALKPLSRPVHRWLMLLISLWLISTSVTAQDAAYQRAMAGAIRNAAGRVLPSVVTIEIIGTAGIKSGEVEQDAPTSGIVVDEEGFVIASSIVAERPSASILVVLPDGSRHAAKVVARDHHRDLVLLKIKTDAPLVPIPWPESPPNLRIGQTTIAVGRYGTDASPMVSGGVLSATQRLDGIALQTDARVSASLYGGPLIDLRGNFIGVLIPAVAEGGAPDATSWYDSGIAFAIPSTVLRAKLDRLRDGQDIKKGLIGIVSKSKDPYENSTEIAAVRTPLARRNRWDQAGGSREVRGGTTCPAPPRDQTSLRKF